jgi:ubiquinone/menaquinone biosynthesis C-methylase UbiE
MKNDYLKLLQTDKAQTRQYHTKSVVKTEQQKALERMLVDAGIRPRDVADLACGGGTLSHHLKVMFPEARFTLCDMDPFALELSQELNGHEGFTYQQEDLSSLSGLKDNSFDLVCCWQTLLCLDEPETALMEMIRITRPGGRIYCSALFNLDHDLDIRAQLLDHTRPSGAAGQWVPYNTYSRRTVDSWLNGRVESHRLHAFTPQVDLTTESKGLGTYTVNSERGRLQISGGFLMNWAILEIVT